MTESRRGRLLPALALVAGLAQASCTAIPRAPLVLIEVRTTGPLLAFEPARLTVPAEARLELTFRNLSEQPHNLTFAAPLEVGTRTIVEPGESDLIEVGPTAPGEYRYVCTIHAGMEGLLRVE